MRKLKNSEKKFKDETENLKISSIYRWNRTYTYILDINVSNKFYLNKNKIHSAHVNKSNGINGI